MQSNSALQHQEAAVAASDGGSSYAEQQQQQQRRCYPLLINHWQAVTADLAEVPLADCLHAASFQSNCCTIWLAEALLYYLPLDTVSATSLAYTSLKPAYPSVGSTAAVLYHPAAVPYMIHGYNMLQQLHDRDAAATAAGV